METNEGVEILVAKLDKIEAKLDIVKDHCAAIDVTIATNTADIKHHIRRTDILETRVEQVAADVKPIKEHVVRIKGILWVLGGIVALAEIVFRVLLH